VGLIGRKERKEGSKADLADELAEYDSLANDLLNSRPSFIEACVSASEFQGEPFQSEFQGEPFQQ
jgi:hypothetical protein